MLPKSIKIFSFHLEKLNDISKELWNFLDGFDYHIDFISENCFTITSNQKFLTAFPDGRLEFQAIFCRDWEKFYVLDNNSEKLLDSFQKDQAYQKNKINKCYELYIKNNQLKLRLNTQNITPSFFPSGYLYKNDQFMEYKTIKNNTRISKTKKLVYFCVYGKEEYYECLNISIQSLVIFGEFEGDILIKTDDIERCKKYLDAFKNNLIFELIEPELGIFNRYLMNEDLYKNYGSIIYLDADILTLNPVSNFFNKSARKSDFCIYSEFKGNIKKHYINKNSEWFGLNFIKDLSLIKKYHLLNSGFFIINNVKEIKKVFEQVTTYKKFEKIYGDQPFLNIALYSAQIDLKILKPDNYLSFSRSHEDFLDNLDKVFIHYNSGVGNLSKLSLMKNGYNFLLNQKNSDI